MPKKYFTFTMILIFAGLAFLLIKITPATEKVAVPTKNPVLGTETYTKSCPEGFVSVPGNSTYGTKDFCVMKYDAKCSNPDPKCVTAEGVYKNDDANCTCRGNFKVVSTANGTPITFIPEVGNGNNNAKDYCQNSGWHLLTNSEWMTIARNIEQVPDNWCNRDASGCGNPPGTAGKILANGHNDGTPSRALTAGSDSDPTFGTNPNPQKRTLTLSNGEVIWDFAGNVWQWVDALVARKNEPRTIIPGYGNSRWTWTEFPNMPYDANYMPQDPNLDSKSGVGRIFHFNAPEDTDTTLYTDIRGGNWRHGNDSGAFTTHLQPVPTKTGIDDVGFRCAVNL